MTKYFWINTTKHWWVQYWRRNVQSSPNPSNLLPEPFQSIKRVHGVGSWVSEKLPNNQNNQEIASGYEIVLSICQRK